jgi:hypothetical protein
MNDHKCNGIAVTNQIKNDFRNKSVGHEEVT